MTRLAAVLLVLMLAGCNAVEPVALLNGWWLGVLVLVFMVLHRIAIELHHLLTAICIACLADNRLAGRTARRF